MMSWDRYNCDKCGQLVYSGTLGAGWVFVPDADIPGMYEEDLMRCPRCVKKHGCPLPSQLVVVSKCCGINTPNGELPYSRPIGVGSLALPSNARLDRQEEAR
jgi:hypothetical protein